MRPDINSWQRQCIRRLHNRIYQVWTNAYTVYVKTTKDYEPGHEKSVLKYKVFSVKRKNFIFLR